MLDYLTGHLIRDVAIFQAALLLVILSNLWLLRRARRHPAPRRLPPLAVLIPARDEAAVIGRCVRSLLAQEYPDLRVFVLDDHSTDATRAILDELAAADQRLTVLAGRPLPPGWLGKPWACAQLAEAAAAKAADLTPPAESPPPADGTPPLLLFTDADTRFAPGALRALAAAQAGERADLLTGFPAQEMRCWGERLTVPFFSWAALAFSPLALAYQWKLPLFASAVGQMLLFSAPAYRQIGGHAAVRADIAEDIALARRASAAGLRWRSVYLTDLVSSRMYAGGQAAFAGFSKNFFAAFGFRVLPYLFVFGWLVVMAWGPLAALALHALGLAGGARLPALLLCLALALLVWLVPYRALGFGLLPALLYPLTVLAAAAIALNSLRLALRGRLSWKGRSLGPARWRWL